MRIDCYFTHQFCEAKHLIGRDALVIDVLRATSSIITALEAGAKAIIPVAEITEALELAHALPGSILAGEREGERLAGFELGNSPFEFKPEIVGGRIIISCSTNGTAAITKAASAKRIWLAALLNSRAVASKLLGENVHDLAIICSGTMAEPSLDDILSAGAVLHQLTCSANLLLNDSAQIALSLYKNSLTIGIRKALNMASHAQKLIRFDHEKDVEYCSQENISITVPWLNKQDGRIYS